VLSLRMYAPPLKVRDTVPRVPPCTEHAYKFRSGVNQAIQVLVVVEVHRSSGGLGIKLNIHHMTGDKREAVMVTVQRARERAVEEAVAVDKPLYKFGLFEAPFGSTTSCDCFAVSTPTRRL
jgi:hypothetical protein